MKPPLISVIIPAYNAEKWIAGTIASVLDQTLSDLEVIVVDDGSKDGTSAIAMSVGDSRVHVISKPNGGVSTARNVGIEKARGTYLAFLDADDLMTPDSIEVKVNNLVSAGVDWVFSDIWRCDEEMDPIGEAERGTDGDVVRTILSGRGIGIPGISSNILTHRRCFESGLRFDPELSNSADQDIAIGLAQNFTYKRVPVPLNKYRTSPDSMSRNIALFEKDLIYLFRKADRMGLLKDAAFRRYALANAYWSIGGAWWKNAGAPGKAIPFFIKALLLRPVLLFRPLRKK